MRNEMVFSLWKIWLVCLFIDFVGGFLKEMYSDNATPLSFYQSATIGQLFSVAKCAARLHSGMDRPELQPIWSSLTGHVYLDLFVDEFQVTGFPLLKVYPGNPKTNMP